MPSELGDQLTARTVRLAIACYVARLAVDASGTTSEAGRRHALQFWTAGFSLFLIHVVCVFHFFHDWSHAVAYEYTAKRTAEMTGFDWGGGLYLNYLFAALWGADVVAWWCRGATAMAPAWLYWTVQGYMAFMVFNATVVFGPSFWIPVGAAAIFGLLGIRIWKRRQDSPRPGE